MKLCEWIGVLIADYPELMQRDIYQLDWFDPYITLYFTGNGYYSPEVLEFPKGRLTDEGSDTR